MSLGKQALVLQALVIDDHPHRRRKPAQKIVGIMVEQAASLQRLAVFVPPVRDDLERTGVDLLHEVAQQQTVPVEAGRVADDVSLRLASLRIGSLLDAKQFRVEPLGAAEVSKKTTLDAWLGEGRSAMLFVLAEVFFDHLS